MNTNIYLSEGNKVLIQNEEYGFLVFSLLAGVSCPYKTGICSKICYGRAQQELFEHVYECRERNLEETFKDTFVQDMIELIEYNLRRKKYKNRVILFRWHDVGDIHSRNYMDKIVEIVNHFKGNDRILFQTYTKSLPIIREYNLKDINMKIMYSVMEDTPLESIEEAKALGLNIFKAVPFNEFEALDEKNKCIGSCSKCKACYIGEQDMCVEYHGSRIPGGTRARVEKDKKYYWGIGHNEGNYIKKISGE